MEIKTKNSFFTRHYSIEDIDISIGSNDARICNAMDTYIGAFLSEVKNPEIKILIGEFECRKLNDIISLGNGYFMGMGSILVFNPRGAAKFDGDFRWVLKGNVFDENERITLYFQNSEKNEFV